LALELSRFVFCGGGGGGGDSGVRLCPATWGLMI